MTGHDASRRSLLEALAAALGVALVPPGFGDLIAAAQAPGDATLRFFDAAEARDVEAVAAQIIPTDDTPGAREAGVVYFIDGGMATFFSHVAGFYRERLGEFRTAFRQAHPGVESFASLPADQQVAFLQTVDRTPFFEATRFLTLLGMLSLPSYGGNRDGRGWKLLGVDDGHAFQPPFGYYDRDYPGFATDRGEGR
jgi:gluconate 2-dehydrogenase gamma chain